MAVLSSDATLEASVHFRSESEIREFLKNPSERSRERLGTHGHVAVARALHWNRDPHGVVRALLERLEVQVNLPGEDGNTALYTAVSLQDKTAIEMLLKRPDLDPNVGSQLHNEAPLHKAAKGSCVEVLRMLLLDPRVNVAALNSQNQTAVILACRSSTDQHRVDRVREFVVSPASTVNSVFELLKRRDQFGRTGLHYLAETRGADETVALMLTACGRNGHELARIEDDQGHLAIHIAMTHQHLGIVRLLLPFVGESEDRDRRVLRHAVRSGNTKIFDEVYRSLRGHVAVAVEKEVDQFVELLGVTTHYDMASFLLKHLGEGKHDYVANLVGWAVTHSHRDLLGAILRWYPGQAWSAFKQAGKSKNKPIQRLLLEHKTVKARFARLYKQRESDVDAAHAILLVAVLVATLTYSKCLTSLESANLRKDIAELQQGQYGGPPLVAKFHIVDLVVLDRVAFFLSMVSTILAAIAALPFSFAFKTYQAVDDMHVMSLVGRAPVLIASASYCLLFSLWALVFSFVCSQWVAPYFDFNCRLACIIAFTVFWVLSFAFVGCKGVKFCVFRWKQRNRKRREQGMDDVELARLSK